MELIVIEPPVNFNPSLLTCHYQGDSESLNLDFKLRQVKLKKLPEEIKLARRIYRQEYMRKPEVRAKLKKRLENPKIIEARKKYSEDPRVKSRKKYLSKRSRELKNLLKKEHPGIYNNLLDKVEPLIIGPDPARFCDPNTHEMTDNGASCTFMPPLEFDHGTGSWH